MEQKNQDMTSGSLAKGILFFSIPLMLSNILQVLFNMSDIAVVGHFAGAMALGSVGSTTILVTMFTGFLIGLSGGINVLVALYYGAKNERGVKETVHSAAILSLIIGVILLLFANRKIRKQPYILVVSCKDEAAEQRITEILAKAVEYYTVKSKTVNAAGIEFTAELRTKDAETAFVNRITELEGVGNATLVSYNGEYMG